MRGLLEMEYMARVRIRLELGLGRSLTPTVLARIRRLEPGPQECE